MPNHDKIVNFARRLIIFSLFILFLFIVAMGYIEYKYGKGPWSYSARKPASMESEDIDLGGDGCRKPEEPKDNSLLLTEDDEYEAEVLPNEEEHQPPEERDYVPFPDNPDDPDPLPPPQPPRDFHPVEPAPWKRAAHPCTFHDEEKASTCFSSCHTSQGLSDTLTLIQGSDPTAGCCHGGGYKGNSMNITGVFYLDSTANECHMCGYEERDCLRGTPIANLPERPRLNGKSVGNFYFFKALPSQQTKWYWWPSGAPVEIPEGPVAPDAPSTIPGHSIPRFAGPKSHNKPDIQLHNFEEQKRRHDRARLIPWRRNEIPNGIIGASMTGSDPNYSDPGIEDYVPPCYRPGYCPN